MLREHHLTVTKTARYFTLGDVHETLRQVWFVCHGYGQLAGRFLRHFEDLDDGHRLIVAPEALSRFYVESGVGASHADVPVGATWMTREDRLSEIADYVSYLDALYAQMFQDVRRERVGVYVLGFSQGVATVCRWVGAAGCKADALILWGGLIPNDLELPAVAPIFRQLRLTTVAGERDSMISREHLDKQEERLSELGIPHRLITFDGGHHLDRALLGSLAAS
jgi:predicted esterase